MPGSFHSPGQPGFARPSGCFFALLLDARAWPAQSMVVRADRAETIAGTMTLWDGERAVHHVPAEVVVSADAYPTQLAAEGAVRAFRQKNVGGATVHVAEAGAPARGRPRSVASTAIPAEGISFRVKE